ncbi:alkaline phosphatase [Roseimicrobium sp. ORNL1]|nr:alkaline phosphatase [Roseimicrobium sp. ORNL1]
MIEPRFPTLSFLGCAAMAVLAPLSVSAKSPHSISMTPISSVAAGSFLTSAAEIVAHDPATQRIFVVNAQAARVDVYSIANPAQPIVVGSIDASAFGGVANSVAVHDGAVAVAVESTVKTNPGKVVFFNTNLEFLAQVTVGSLPDMLTFTPNGRYVLTADEGEPSDDYTVDPEGTVSIIDVSKGVASVTQADVRTANFRAYNSKTRAELFNGTGTGPKPAIRVFGPNATVAQDLEPEYITVSQDSKTAWVTLQEGNAIGIIDIDSATVKDLVGLGTKDHSLASNGFGSSNALDASDRDGIPVANNGRINIQNWPVKGLYLPDGIDCYKVGNQTYLVLANEGDSREWSGYAEETRVGSMALDPTAFPPAVATELKKNNNLGRLKATKAQGDTNGNNVYKEIYTFGARSFSIRDAQGNLVWDSGDQFEQILAQILPDFFNSNHEINKFDDRSDDKGPEAESVTVGKAFGRTYAFVALERISGVMIFDITDPTAPEFVQYADNRDFTKATNTAAAGDLGPEGLFFVSEENSPNGKPLLLVANEVSGTTTVYEISKVKGKK